MPRTRPRVTPSDALLLFVTEPQQLDAVFEFGTETLSVDSIRLADDDRPIPGLFDDDDDRHDSDRALDEDADRYEEV